MVVLFRDGQSFTGEAMAEIHCHGGRAVVAAISDRLRDLGCRLAEPGEFARRAFEAQKMGLPELEGLADLIAAETEAQRRQAIRIMSGSVSDLAERWRAEILRACALIEVTIDWVDEEVPVDVRPEVREILDSLIVELKRELQQSRGAKRVRDGFEVAIVGPPNVGKSSLLNYLSGREAAIVSDVPGTTRDVIEVRYDLGGLPVTFLDTAGIRQSEDENEKLGIDRALDRAANADLRIVLWSADTVSDARVGSVLQVDDLWVQSKADLGDVGDGAALSAIDGQGIDELLADLERRLVPMANGAGTLAHLRHEDAVAGSVEALEGALALTAGGEPEIIAEELRRAARKLEFLVGRIDTEAVLDTVFGAFCLGK